ncbi:MAG: hypothetical protein JOZ43_06160, partial [Acidobacteriales bacterium]|nr:hypothetical protein [Terriglobales bacterium]
AFRLGDDVSNIQAAGSALNARYLLTGTLRRAGNRIRVTAQLSDSVTTTMIWSRSYDRSLEDLFAVQEDIAKSIVSATGGQLIRAGSERLSTAPKESLDAWGLTRRAYHFWNHAFHPGGIAEALSLLQQAVQIDPEYAVAQAYLALYEIETVVNVLAPDPVGLRKAAFDAAQRALELAPSDPEVLEVTGLVMLHCRQFERAVHLLRRSVKVAPFNLVAWGYLGLTLGWAGDETQTAEGVNILRRLLADTPDHPSVPYWQYFLSGGLVSQQKYAEAANAARACVEQQPRLYIANISLANACGAAGDHTAANAAWQAALVVHPGLTMDFYRSEILYMTRTEERGAPHWVGLVAAGIMSPESTKTVVA